MAEIAIYVDSISSTSASGRLNVYNAGPSMGATAYGHIFLNLYTRIGSSSGAAINRLDPATWSVSGLSPGTTYDLDAFMTTSTSTPSTFFDSGSSDIFATSVSFTTTAAAPTWTDNSITSTARVGSYYSSSISASNATSYTWSGLPPGINPNGGSIAGFPSTAGSYSVSFYASGPGGNSSTITRTINVANRYPSWTDNTVSTNMRQGVSYSDGVSANYVSNYSASGTLPAGLSFNTSNGTFSGTPTSPGSTYTFAFQALNADGDGIGTSNFTVTVKYPLATWNDNTISTVFTIDTPYSDSISASNAAGYAVSSGSLPDGISLDTSTGVISGIPVTPGTFNFTLSAYNGSNEYIYTSPFSVTIDDIGGKVFVYDGSAWVERELDTYSAGWSKATVYYYDGAQWQKSLQ
jgi:hypothetical protein